MKSSKKFNKTVYTVYFEGLIARDGIVNNSTEETFAIANFANEKDAQNLANAFKSRLLCSYMMVRIVNVPTAAHDLTVSPREISLEDGERVFNSIDEFLRAYDLKKFYVEQNDFSRDSSL